jgi:hypothetical protein
MNARISDLQIGMNDKFTNLGQWIDRVETRLGKLEDTVMVMREDIVRLQGPR